MSFMEPTPDPSPRNILQPFTQAWQYNVGEKIYLPRPELTTTKSFLEVLTARYSTRKFSRVSAEQLGTFLWYSAKTLATRQSTHCITSQHRHVPSAGGIHPIDLVILDVAELTASVYDPFAHALYKLIIAPEQLAAFLAYCGASFSFENGFVIWFAAHPEKTSVKYTNELSLVWRDTGALLGSMYLIAEAIGLNCCALGALGDQEIQTLLGSTTILGTGGIVIGAK